MSNFQANWRPNASNEGQRWLNDVLRPRIDSVDTTLKEVLGNLPKVWELVWGVNSDAARQNSHLRYKLLIGTTGAHVLQPQNPSVQVGDAIWFYQPKQWHRALHDPTSNGYHLRRENGNNVPVNYSNGHPNLEWASTDQPQRRIYPIRPFCWMRGYPAKPTVNVKYAFYGICALYNLLAGFDDNGVKMSDRSGFENHDDCADWIIWALQDIQQNPGYLAHIGAPVAPDADASASDSGEDAGPIVLSD